MRGRSTDRVTPFGQVLTGAVVTSYVLAGQSDSFTHFAVQPGGAVDTSLASSNTIIRLEGDYGVLFSVQEAGTVNELRFVAGIVFSR